MPYLRASGQLPPSIPSFRHASGFHPKIAHSAGCPNRGMKEFPSFFGKDSPVFEGFFATDRSFESDLSFLVAWFIAAEHDHLVSLEEVGQVLRIDSPDPIRAIDPKLEIGQHRFGNLGVEARELVLEVFLGQGVLAGGLGLLRNLVEEVGVALVPMPRQKTRILALRALGLLP